MNPASLAKRLFAIQKASQPDPAATPQAASADHWPGHFEGALARPVSDLAGQVTALPLKPDRPELPRSPWQGFTVPMAPALPSQGTPAEIDAKMRSLAR